MGDQTHWTRRAVAAMFPAQWDDPYVDWCDICGKEIDPTTAHDPHEDDCPRVLWGADLCSCSRTTCAACCPECVPTRYHAGFARAVAITVVAVAAVAGLVWSWWYDPGITDPRCPDPNGACIYEPYDGGDGVGG
jgi:hypothetical protein